MSEQKPRLAAIMDSPDAIHTEKDTTLCLLEAASRCGWSAYYVNKDSLSADYNMAWARCCQIDVDLKESGAAAIHLAESCDKPLSEFDAVLMRQDPPIDMEFIHNCQLLSLARQHGVLVVNDPDSLILLNEKLLSLRFPEFLAPSLVSKDLSQIKRFMEKEKDVVIKPLDAMGGQMVRRLRSSDADAKEAVEQLSHKGTRSIMTQKLIEGWEGGDKRVLIIGGRTVEQALLRVPPAGQFISNLAAGGRGEASVLSARERLICERVAPLLMERGILLAGIDIINGYLTEINISSPTGMREINRFFNLDLGMRFMDSLRAEVKKRA